MAYKYKLAEINPTVFPQAAKAASSTVKSVNKGEKIPGEQFGELEDILREKGIDEDTITDILDTWAERHLFVHMNEIDSLNPVLNKIRPTDLDTNPEQEKYNKTKGNTYMTPEERNMTPEERKEQERKEREKQGKKNLTQEILRRLKNR